MSKTCPFCEKRINNEGLCSNCLNAIAEKIEYPLDWSKAKNKESINKKISDWLKKPFKLTKVWVAGGITLLALVYLMYFIPKLNNTKTTQQLGQVTILTKCTRTSPYKMPPEFERALSLIRQRLKEYVPDSGIPEYWNCLNIQYTDLKKVGDNAEGVFMVDKSVSNPSNLVIYVDNSYHSYDDLLTAVLLVHEINHAAKHYDFVVYGKSLKSCMNQEVEAFQTQFTFLKTLNPEERNSIFYRIGTIIDTGRSAQSMPSKELNPALINLNQMITIFLNAAKYQCNMDQECTEKLTSQGIRNMVENSPAYQKQCKTNYQ